MELVMEQEAPAGEVCLTPEAMDAYLDTLRQQGRSADTLAAYRRSIYGLYRSLPPDKRVGRGTLDRWRETLEDQGYLPRTINVRLAAANGLMTYLGHRELQATAALPPPAEGERPELTRGEYLRLLSTARVLEKERLYLLVKVFGSTGLSVGGAAPADGGGAGWAGTQPRASAAAAGGGAAGLCGPAGHHRRTGVPQPERAAHAADPGDGRDPVPVPGRPGAGGKREPTLSAPAVAEDPGCHPDQCGPAGGPGLRPDDGGGTVLRGLGCRKGGGDDVTTPPSSRLRWHEYQLLRRKEMT